MLRMTSGMGKHLSHAPGIVPVGIPVRRKAHAIGRCIAPVNPPTVLPYEVRCGSMAQLVVVQPITPPMREARGATPRTARFAGTMVLTIVSITTHSPLLTLKRADSH